ncbi:conserved hypothetical protein [Histoplasma capsulatum H143]|uniref:Uncharacterized protein n=1 Tax=Ajellomyces capsulatus (strain H143) TaxID=544712 RepID=C6HNI6_AJECH|nr:conserved hypothetical protein [Histoplasma capsulatum H143]
MEDSLPPLSDVAKPSVLKSGGVAGALNRPQAGEGGHHVKKTKLLCSDADVILEFTRSPPPRSRNFAQAKYRMGVSSTLLKESSMYFRVILDPDKFREGRELFEKTAQLGAKCGAGGASMNDAVALVELPTISIELPLLAGVFDKADLVETFLKVLQFCGTNSHNDRQTEEILDHLGKQSISFVANLIVLSDKFGGQQALKWVLNIPLNGARKPVGQTLMSKTLRRLQASQIGDEERTRHAIYVALLLGYNDEVAIFTHMLIIGGSREWMDGGRDGWVGIDRPLWWHLPNGIEDSNVVGCTKIPAPATPFTWEKSSAFSAHELKPYILNPLYHHKSEEHITRSSNSPQPPSPPPTNISNILSSLRQCPEYQIDPNHAGCGLRRRLLPALDCLASFTTNHSNAAGICLAHFNNGSNSDKATSSSSTRHASVGSWRNHKFRDAVMVGIGAGKVDSIMYSNDGRANDALEGLCTCVPDAELARAVFTSRSRVWNL